MIDPHQNARSAAPTRPSRPRLQYPASLTPHSPAGRPLSAEDRAAIFHNVRDAAAQVITRKGATNWAVGLAVARILEAVLRDENRVLTVSRLLAGEFGLADVCLSLPCLVSRSGAGATLPVPVSDEELVALRHSAGTLKSAARSLGF